MIDCVVSIISSSFSDPAARPVFCSSSSNRSASAFACSGIVIFGRVTTKLSGSLPPLFSNKVETKISRVRILRARSSSLKGLIRIPRTAGCYRASLRNFACGRRRVVVFLIVRSITVTILKIDAKILHWLASQFFSNATVNCMRQPRRLMFLANELRLNFQLSRQICGFGSGIR